MVSDADGLKAGHGTGAETYSVELYAHSSGTLLLRKNRCHLSRLMSGVVRAVSAVRKYASLIEIPVKKERKVPGNS